MAGVTREIRFNIKADVDQAIRAITDMGREIDSQSGKVKADFDAQRFNDNVRNSVGVLGDIDTAMQTLGSTLQIEGLQIVGDFFAIGEAAAQLAGAVPLLISGFTGLLPALIPLAPILIPLAAAAGAVGLAVHVLTQDYRDQQAEIERVTKATDEMNKRLDSLGATLGKMSAGELADYVHGLELQRDIIATQLDLFGRMGIVSMDLENALYEVTQSMNQAVEAMDMETFNQWADNVRDFSDMTEAEAERQKQILEQRLATEQMIFDEASKLYGENSEQAKEVARGIEEITASLEYMNEIDYSKTAANIALLREEGFDKLADIGSGLGGLFNKVKDNFGGFFENALDGAMEGAKDSIAEQEKINQQAQKEYESYLKELARLQEQEKRERERALQEQERELERQLSTVESFERRKYEIEQGYREATFEATLGNDVEAFLNARRERKTARREERMFGTTININGLNVGALSTPEDIENAKQTIIDAMSQVMMQQAGTF